MTTLVVPAGGLEPGRAVDVDTAEAHHLRVRREADGARVRLVDGAGAVALGVLHQRGGRWAVAIETVTRVAPPEPLLLVVGAGDRERFGWLAEKATELGATALVPVETARSRSVGNRVRAEGVERLRRRSIEALKQCGGAWAPEVLAPIGLTEALTLGEPGGRWVALATAPAGPGPVPRTGLAVLVGPEGGFEPAEQMEARDAGWTPVRLAPTTLRFETAALAALAVVAASRVSPSP